MTPQERESYLEIAYNDVREAFLYYLEHYNEGNPIVLAGFSQGADMCLRLLKDVFEDDSLQERLVACYAIGWQISGEELENYPQLKMAQNETDTGVIVSFNSEAEFVEDSLMIPEGTRSYAINPLNWKTDGQWRINLSIRELVSRIMKGISRKKFRNSPGLISMKNEVL